MDILIEAHSGLRWLVLIALTVTAAIAFRRSAEGAEPSDRWLSWVAILFDIQVAIGIVLYLANSGWDQGGFIAVFHPIAMVAATGVLHAGLGRGRKTGGGAGWKTIGIMTLVALAIVFLAIPWQR